MFSTVIVWMNGVRRTWAVQYAEQIYRNRAFWSTGRNSPRNRIPTGSTTLSISLTRKTRQKETTEQKIKCTKMSNNGIPRAWVTIHRGRRCEKFSSITAICDNFISFFMLIIVIEYYKSSMLNQFSFFWNLMSRANQLWDKSTSWF